MATAPRQLERADFDRWVADALRQLYDISSLTHNPLCDLVAESEDSPITQGQCVRRLLLEAIRAQRPSEEMPRTTRDWRLYLLLELRYIEGRSVADAMQQLGIERSQYYRDHTEALELISDHVWATYLTSQDGGLSESVPSTAGVLRTEIARLALHHDARLVRADELLLDLETLLEPLCATKACFLRIQAERIPAVRAPIVLLRQAVLLSAQTALALHQSHEMLVTTYRWGSEYGIRVIAHLAPGTQSSPDSHLADQMLAECQTMLARIGGQLSVLASGTTWEARLVLSEEKRYRVLLVDDNERLADLFARYLVNSNWRLMHAKDGANARRVLGETTVDAILLDVLLPEEDGWTLFAELKQNPTTAATPVIVCSVLRQPGLADALGAFDYLPKPISQEVLLAVLKRFE